jgi:ABC-type antimicrobial peptide transport system permease subunit
MMLTGGLLGILAAMALGKVAESLLFETRGSDPLVMVLVAALLAAVAYGAGYVPAIKASRVDPMRALRYE